MQTAMKRQIKYLTYLVVIESMQITFNCIMSCVAILEPYRRELLFVRILVQAFSSLLLFAVTLYITFKGPRAEQVSDLEAA